MLQNKKKNTDVIVFSRWSRKSYAIFASLKKVVCIARLSIDICKSSLLKNSAVICLLNLIMADEKAKENDGFDEYVDELLLLSIFLPSVVTEKDNCQKKHTSNNLGKSMFCNTQNMDFLFNINLYD